MARLNDYNYPLNYDWKKYLDFVDGEKIVLTFLYRLTAYVKDTSDTKVSLYGFRSIAAQQQAYENYLAGKGNLAAKAGFSWHNYGLAVDFNRLKTVNGKGVYPCTLDDDYRLFEQGKAELTTLYRYGLAHSVKGEPWHVQPIETIGYKADKAWFADTDDFYNTKCFMPMLQLTEPLTHGKHIMLLQQKLNDNDLKVVVDGYYGEKTQAAIKRFQQVQGLTADGIAGCNTWQRLINSDSISIRLELQKMVDGIIEIIHKIKGV